MPDIEVTQSSAINELAHAIIEAQLKLGPVKKEHVNPYYNSKYAGLGEVWAGVRPFLECGIAITQSPVDSPDGYIVLDTQLTHTSGQWMRSRLKMRLAKDDPQGAGSALTYARRYALGCMTGLVTEEDDDGNAASNPLQKPAQTFQQHKRTAQAKIAELRQEVKEYIAENYPAPPQEDDATDGVPTLQGCDAPAAFIWRLGKHKGESIATIPDDYLDWFAQNGKMEDHRDAALNELDRRRGQGAL